MRISLKTLLLTLLVPILIWGAPSWANVDPDSTRYDTTTGGGWHVTVDFASGADSTLWIGFEGWAATVTRMNADVIVQPIMNARRTLTDGPTWQTVRTYANPRIGDPMYFWGPDTLTTDHPTLEYCCGELLGFQLTAMGTAGYLKVYVTGARP